MNESCKKGIFIYMNGCMPVANESALFRIPGPKNVVVVTVTGGAPQNILYTIQGGPIPVICIGL